MPRRKAKPIEIFYFVDPISPKCWGLEPIIKKLSLEYGQYFSIRRVLSGSITTLNIPSQRKHSELATAWDQIALNSGMSCDGSLWLENPICSPFKASIAVKAAEFQGKRLANAFLRKLQEAVFINKVNISLQDNLVLIAESVGLDKNEFVLDLNSDFAAKAFQSDLLVSSDMYVEETPSLVFFHHDIQDCGLKIAGSYSYAVYEQLLAERMSKEPKKAKLPELITFLDMYDLVASKEIAEVYNWSLETVNQRMSELQLAGAVDKIPAKHGDFWRLRDRHVVSDAV